MPRRYRTPDLVAYLNGGEPPTPKSDVYQLGLVLAELFTGVNPQKQSKANDLTDPVELVLDSLAAIPLSCRDPLAQLIGEMLRPDLETRPLAADALDRLIPLVLKVAETADALDGRVL